MVDNKVKPNSLSSSTYDDSYGAKETLLEGEEKKKERAYYQAIRTTCSNP